MSKRRHHSRRRNPGFGQALKLKSYIPTKAEITEVGAILAGNIIQSFAHRFIASSPLPAVLKQDWASVGTSLVAAHIVGMAAKKVLPKYANDIYAGALTRSAAHGIATFTATGAKPGLADYNFNNDALTYGGVDWEKGMADYADPRNAMAMQANMNGMGDYFSAPQMQAAQPNMNGLGDFFSAGQMAHAQGMAVANEIDSQSYS